MGPALVRTKHLSLSGANLTFVHALVRGWHAADPGKVAIIAVFVIAVAIRLALVPVDTRPMQYEIHNIATSVADRAEYADPYLTRTGPTAHYPPVWVLVLAGLRKLFGPDAFSVPQFVLNALVTAIMYALLPWVSVRLGFGLAAGTIAGLAGAMVPVHFLQEVRGADAVPTAVLMIIAAAWIGGGWFEESRVKALAAGLLCGVGCLLNSVLLAVFAAMAVARIWVTAHPRTALTRGAVVAITAAAVMAPWAARNRAALGQWIWTRSNFGLELWQSNNPAAVAEWVENGPADVVHPVWNVEVRRYVARVGEVRAYDADLDSALAWIRSHPGRFMHLTFDRVRLFWFPVTARRVQTAVLWMMLGASAAAMVLDWKAHRDACVAIVSIWISYPLVYYVLNWMLRYRIPIHWTLVLLSGRLCSIAYGRWLSSAPHVSQSTRPRELRVRAEFIT